MRIKRADLPEQNSKNIFDRMRAERQREAAEFRAEGAGAANRIRANADREVTIIKAEATREGERTRGEGDAERNRIFAEAFGRDPDFFGFYRSMQAYEQGLKSGDTRMLLAPTASSSSTSPIRRQRSRVGTPRRRRQPARRSQRACGRRPMAIRRSRAQPGDASRPSSTSRLARAIATPRLVNCVARSSRCAMSDLVVAIGLVMVIEGLLWALCARPGPQAAASGCGECRQACAWPGRWRSRRGSGDLAGAWLTCGRVDGISQPGRFPLG